MSEEDLKKKKCDPVGRQLQREPLKIVEIALQFVGLVAIACAVVALYLTKTELKENAQNIETANRVQLYTTDTGLSKEEFDHLYDIGDYPGLVRGKESIDGELYEIEAPEVLRKIDQYEEYNRARPRTSLLSGVGFPCG